MGPGPEKVALLKDGAAFFSIGFSLSPGGSYEKNGIRYIIDDPMYVARYYRVFSEHGWNNYLVAVDTLSTGLVFYEVR